MLLAILGILHFHKRFRIRFLISEKQVFEDFEWDYVEYVGEGDGNPLQYSCLENPMDGGAW